MKQTRKKLTSDEFLNEVNELSSEVEGAVAIYHTHQELNRLALDRTAIFHALNRDAEFWNVHQHALQTSLFITLARVFDNNPQARSVHKLVAATIAQPELFSREALTSRRLVNGVRPNWLDVPGNVVDVAWVPSSIEDLRHLGRQLRPYTKKFESIYLPIRNTFIAHRSSIPRTTIFEMFERTNYVEVGDILDFLHDLVDATSELFTNGRKPDLGTRVEFYKRHNQQIRDGTRKILTTLVASQSGQAT